MNKVVAALVFLAGIAAGTVCGVYVPVVGVALNPAIPFLAGVVAGEIWAAE